PGPTNSRASRGYSWGRYPPRPKRHESLHLWRRLMRATLSVAATSIRLILATGLVFGVASAAVAQTSTWTGGGAADAWSDPLNWSGTAPTAAGSSALTFAGITRLTPNDDLASYTATAVTFDPAAGAFVLGGNSLTLAGDVTQNSANL